VVTSLAWTGIGRSVAIATRSIAARQQHDLRYFMTASFELGWARHMTGVAHLQVIMIRHFHATSRRDGTIPRAAQGVSHRKTARMPGTNTRPVTAASCRRAIRVRVANSGPLQEEMETAGCLS
jgi:hypothetical protein